MHTHRQLAGRCSEGRARVLSADNCINSHGHRRGRDRDSQPPQDRRESARVGAVAERLFRRVGGRAERWATREGVTALSVGAVRDLLQAHMAATAHTEGGAEHGLKVTFSEQVVELVLQEEQGHESTDQAALVDCFGADGTVICAVCLGRCSRGATLCAGESGTEPIAACASADASQVDYGTPCSMPDVEQGMLLSAEPEGQDAALTQTALRLQCNHVFHVECLSLWMRRASNPSCPTCRASVAPAQLTHVQASSPEIRELIERTVTPPPRSVRWSMPTIPGRRLSARTEGPAATVLGSRWQCKQIIANLALHLGYPMALFGGIGGLLYLWAEL